MAAQKMKSKAGDELEMQRLQEMYRRLPPAKQKIHGPEMLKRIAEIEASLNGTAKKAQTGFTTLQMVLLAILAGVVALGGGFFGIAMLAK